MIQSAIALPMPPAPAIPCAQKPAATKKPRTDDSPRMNSLSGVNASGPLINFITSPRSNGGTRAIAFCDSGSKRGQSSGSSRLLKSMAMPESPQGAGLRS